MDYLNISIVTPTGLKFSGQGKELYFPSINGERGILPNHTPLITTSKQGIVKIIDRTNKISYFVVKNGFVQIDSNKIEIFVESTKNETEIKQMELDEKIKELKKVISKNLSFDDYLPVATELEYYEYLNLVKNMK